MLFNIDRARKAMSRQGLDFLVSTTSENVLYTSDLCWFDKAVSEKLFPMMTVVPYDRDVEPTVIAPKALCGYALLDGTWIQDLRFYGELKFAVVDRDATLTEIERTYAERMRGKTGETGSDRFKLLDNTLREKASPGARIGVDLLDPALPKEYSWKEIPQMFTEIKMVKTEEEIRRMTHAIRINEDSISVLQEALRRNEEQSAIKKMIGEKIASCGGQPVVIDIGMGRNGGTLYLPHPEYRANEGDLVKYDCMLTYEFYWSDFSRTISIGSPNSRTGKFFEAMTSIGDRIIEMARPGIRTDELFSEGIRVGREKLPDFDADQLGHGVGINCREAPMIEPGDKTILEPGMIVNVETPRFLVGGFGFNMEDPLLITENGSKRISTLPRELFIA